MGKILIVEDDPWSRRKPIDVASFGPAIEQHLVEAR
jgi:hypothetical protein